MALLATCGEVTAQTSGPMRGLYWNLEHAQTYGTAGERVAETIAELRAFGVREVHIWLNDNRLVRTCRTFDYTDREGIWTPAALRGFTRSVREAGLTPIFTISPLIQTDAFINSLSGPDGPLTIAREHGGVAIELDVEGNWTEQARARPSLANCNTIPTREATEKLIRAIRNATPASKLIISTTLSNRRRHAQLLEAADIISPQLYGEAFAYTAAQVASALTTFMTENPSKRFAPAVSAQCSPRDAQNSGCGEARFVAGLRFVLERHACDPVRFPAYVVWARREIKDSCATGAPVCSTFGKAYLRRTAQSPVTAVCLAPPADKGKR